MQSVTWNAKWSWILPKYIDPQTEGVHPLRLELDEDDWQRIEDFVVNHQGDASTQELEAFSDWLHDELVARVQTHEGITTLQ